MPEALRPEAEGTDRARCQVIASILAETVTAVTRQARLAAMAGADWLELRLDRLPDDVEPEKLLANLRLPVIVTCRTPRDGGDYRGTNENRRALLQSYVDAGAQGIDLESWETFTPEPRPSLQLTIRSYHNRTGVDDNLSAIRDELLKMGADLAKIAVTAHDFADAAPVLDLMASTDQDASPTVAFAMGRDAWPSRVLACVHGAPFAYGAAGPGLETAPGQPPVERLTGLFDVRHFGPSTMIYGVLGNPARDSWSPWLFNRAFRMLSHDGVYLPFTSAHPEAVLRMLSRRRLRGLSVTAPHKSALISHCHEVDEDTAQAGALNTLVFRAHGAISGHNTDVHGVRQALADAGLDAPGKKAVVLGGGGAARAAALALAQLGCEPVMMPRSLESVRDFAKELGFPLARLDATVMEELDPAVVVHATPVGGPNSDQSEERLLPEWAIRPGCLVLDMIYQARRTPLLRAVEAAGGVPVPGLPMFLAQAQEQLYLFTGRRLPRAVLAELLGER